MNLARACGEHLLRAQVRAPVGGRAWPDQDGTLLAGMSHGAAGIALALRRLHAVTGDDRLEEAARLAVAYEAALFEPERGNWPDLRHGPDTFAAAWCHGGPGIAVARAASTETVNLPDVDAGLALARRMLEQGRPNEDHLSCGRFGLVDVLLTVGERLDQPDLLAEARARGDDITRGRGPNAFVYTDRLPPTVFVPGLFTGAAGVGYEQLRLSDPATFPSVLLFETP